MKGKVFRQLNQRLPHVSVPIEVKIFILDATQKRWARMLSGAYPVSSTLWVMSLSLSMHGVVAALEK
jgi:hypothetical protein